MTTGKNFSYAKRYFLNSLLALSLVTVFVTSGCSVPNVFSKKQTRNGQYRPTGNNPMPQTGNAPKNETQTPIVETTNDQSELLVGTWRYSYNLYGTSCQGEFIYKPNHVYQLLETCDNGNQIFLTGEWQFIGAGVLAHYLRDYHPKVDALGSPLHFPEKDGYEVVFNNRNQVTFRSLAYNAPFTLYRVY